MHPLTTLLATLLLSTTLMSALPTANPYNNTATQPRYSTRSDKDPIHPPIHHPGAQVRRQKVAQPPRWKRSADPEPELSAGQVNMWLPPHRNYLPVPEKAFKARDIDADTDSDIEKRHKVRQPSAFTPMYWKNWKRSDDSDTDSDIERRQKVAQGWAYNPNHVKPGWKRSDTNPADADSDIERRQKVAQGWAYNPNHVKPGWKRSDTNTVDADSDIERRQKVAQGWAYNPNYIKPGWKRSDDAVIPHLGRAVPHVAREAPAQDTMGSTETDAKGGEEGDVKEKREKGSDAPWANKPWWSTSSGREQAYW